MLATIISYALLLRLVLPVASSLVSKVNQRALARGGMRSEQLLSSGELQVLDRMQWWVPAGEPLPPTDSYVIFTPDNGGPNNIRIGWEMTGLVAKGTGRTFVLPPASSMYLLDFGPMTLRSSSMGKNASEEAKAQPTTTRIEDLINMRQLKGNVPTLTWKEFQQRTGMTFEEATKEAAMVPQDRMCDMNAYKNVSARILYLPGDSPRREGFSCGDWAERGGPHMVLKQGMTDAMWALLTHGFVWHEDMFAAAAKVVNFLGLFQYNAMHARYNDFQFHEDQQTQQAIFKKWAPVFDAGRKLYIASDEPERFRNVSANSGLTAFTFQDMLSGPDGALVSMKAHFSPLRWFKMLGPVEELICTFSRVFVGTGRSSFSGHINRMRVHAEAPTTRMLTHMDPVPLTAIREETKTWDARRLNTSFVRKRAFEGDAFLQMGPGRLVKDARKP